MIYLDSAAIVKLVKAEDHSAALLRWLEDRPDEQLIASALVDVEVPRAIRRVAPHIVAAVPGVLGQIHRVEITATIRQRAAAHPTATLRSLDAIHLATAAELADNGIPVSAFVTYDQRLAGCAHEQALTVAAPES